MKWELYLTRREWRELQAAVRERATPAGEKKPRCEKCGMVHGTLKRNKAGYMFPKWLDTAHKHGAPLKSKNPDDYYAFCRRCHTKYDRHPEGMEVGRYRDGYAVTTTDTLLSALSAIGLEIWGVVSEGWYWQFDDIEGGPEENPALAVAAAVAKIKRLSSQVAV
jgi:hypothetical protein